jgi:hypothetical protein
MACSGIPLPFLQYCKRYKNSQTDLKQDVRVWTGLSWLKTGYYTGLLYSNEHSDFIKDRKLPQQMSDYWLLN